MKELEDNREVIILVALPGAGKSSFTLLYPNHVRINQDLLGSRSDCLSVMRILLKEGKSVIIDRTNINKQQRKFFLDLAKEYNVPNIKCIYLDVPADVCIERIKNRKDHPNLTSETSHDTIIEIVSSFNKSLELPDEKEGFTSILYLDVDAIELLRRSCTN